MVGALGMNFSFNGGDFKIRSAYAKQGAQREIEIENLLTGKKEKFDYSPNDRVPKDMRIVWHGSSADFRYVDPSFMGSTTDSGWYGFLPLYTSIGPGKAQGWARENNLYRLMIPKAPYLRWFGQFSDQPEEVQEAGRTVYRLWKEREGSGVDFSYSAPPNFVSQRAVTEVEDFGDWIGDIKRIENNTVEVLLPSGVRKEYQLPQEEVKQLEDYVNATEGNVKVLHTREDEVSSYKFHSVLLSNYAQQTEQPMSSVSFRPSERVKYEEAVREAQISPEGTQEISLQVINGRLFDRNGERWGTVEGLDDAVALTFDPVRDKLVVSRIDLKKDEAAMFFDGYDVSGENRRQSGERASGAGIYQLASRLFAREQDSVSMYQQEYRSKASGFLRSLGVMGTENAKYNAELGPFWAPDVVFTSRRNNETGEFVDLREESASMPEGFIYRKRTKEAQPLPESGTPEEKLAWAERLELWAGETIVKRNVGKYTIEEIRLPVEQRELPPYSYDIKTEVFVGRKQYFDIHSDVAYTFRRAMPKFYANLKGARLESYTLNEDYSMTIELKRENKEAGDLEVTYKAEKSGEAVLDENVEDMYKEGTLPIIREKRTVGDVTTLTDHQIGMEVAWKGEASPEEIELMLRGPGDLSRSPEEQVVDKLREGMELPEDFLHQLGELPQPMVRLLRSAKGKPFLIQLLAYPHTPLIRLDIAGELFPSMARLMYDLDSAGIRYEKVDRLGERYATAASDGGDVINLQKQVIGQIGVNIDPQVKALYKEWKKEGGRGKAVFQSEVAQAFYGAEDVSPYAKVAATYWDTRGLGWLWETAKDYEELWGRPFPLFEDIEREDMKKLFATFVDHGKARSNRDSFRGALNEYFTEYLQGQLGQKRKEGLEGQEARQAELTVVEATTPEELARVRREIEELPESLSMDTALDTLAKLRAERRASTDPEFRRQKQAEIASLNNTPAMKEYRKKRRELTQLERVMKTSEVGRLQEIEAAKAEIQRLFGLQKRTMDKAIRDLSVDAVEAQRSGFFNYQQEEFIRKLQKDAGTYTPTKDIIAALARDLEAIDDNLFSKMPASKKVEYRNELVIRSFLEKREKIQDTVLRLNNSRAVRINEFNEDIVQLKGETPRAEELRTILKDLEDADKQIVLEAGGELLPDGSVDLTAAVENQTETLLRQVLGGENFGKRTDRISSVSRRANRAIQNIDPSRVFSNGFKLQDVLMQDMDAIGRLFMQNLGADLMFWRKVGTLNPLANKDEWLTKMRKEKEEAKKMNPEDTWLGRVWKAIPWTRSDWSGFVEYMYERRLDDLVVQVERARHIPREKNPYSASSNAGRIYHSAVYASSGGSVALASLVDPIKLTAANGVRRTFGGLFRMISSDILSLKTTKEQAQITGTAVEYLNSTVLTTLAGAEDPYIRGSTVERRTHAVNRAMSLANLIIPLTQALKRVGAGLAISAHSNMIRRAMEEAHQESITGLLKMNIGPKWIERMWDEMLRPGGSSLLPNGDRVPNTANWTDWEAEEVWRQAIAAKTDFTTPQPGRSDTANLADVNQWARVFFIFRKFNFAMATKIMLAWRQDFTDQKARQLFYMVSSIFTASMAYYFRAVVAGGYMWEKFQEDPAETLIVEGVNGSGLISGLGAEAYLFAERTPGISARLKGEPFRGSYGRPVQQIFGVGESYGWNIQRTLMAAAEGDRRDFVKGMAPLLPAWRLFYLRQLTREAEEALAGPPKGRERKREKPRRL